MTDENTGALTPAPSGATPPDAPATDNVPAPPKDGGGEQSDFTPFYKGLPETWRDDIVKGLDLGEAEANVLGRYSTFDDFGKAFFEQHKKIRQGAAKSDTLPENPTEDQIKEYRESHGIPADPGGYKDTLPEGVVLSDEDDRILSVVWTAAHALNAPPALLAALHGAFFQAREQEATRVMDQHGIDKQTCTQHLRDFWGSDTETNLNAIRGLLATVSEEDREELEQAELPNGKKLFNHAPLVQWFAQKAREINPAATVVPNAQNPAQAITAEIEKIEKMMRDEPDEYWKSESTQKRYEQLLEAQEGLQRQGQNRAA